MVTNDDRELERCDVLVVGAGPTGLTLAAELTAFGASVRLVDAATDRVHESRALALQPRTLEVLRGLGVADELVRRGNRAVDLWVHAGRHVRQMSLADIGLDDTAFPYLLFLSQAETEAVLGAHLAASGVHVERPVRFVGYEDADAGVLCRLETHDGTPTHLLARYLVGCDGAHSTVRREAGITFRGGRYPQTFLLADLGVDGLVPGTVNAFLTDDMPLLVFPLGHPTPWRIVAFRREGPGGPPDPGAVQSTTPVALAELQALADATTGGRLRLHDPVWASAFRVHHRLAARYRTGRVFLAGDAAHVHSPAGAQGL